LKEREGLAQGAKRILHAGFAVELRRRVLRFEQSTDRARDRLRNAESFRRDLGIPLQLFEGAAKRLTSPSRLARR
jgi:hypothetical protein